MEGVFHAPIEVPRLSGLRPVNGHAMGDLAGWRILDGRPYVMLSHDYGRSCEMDLESTVPVLGFMPMAAIVGAVGGAAAKDEDVATFYGRCTKALWSSFKHQVKIEQPIRRQ
jgi:hypothetical protein